MVFNTSARATLWIITFLGFAVNYMVRINANIAIVAMVQTKIYNNVSHIICYETHQNNDSFEEIRDTLEKGNVNKFDWDAKEQNQVLGGFYWLHWVLQIPGGLMSRRYGSKAVFGLSNLLCALFSIIMPQAAYLNLKVLVTLRVLQGLIGGATWPSAHHLTAVWIPPNERSKFVSAFLGSSVGVAITYPLCGVIMDYMGWEWVYYITGLLGVAWFIVWWYLVYDSPSTHPRIDPQERDYIEKSIGSTLSEKENMSVPWRELLTSVPVWTIILIQFGGTWGLFTMLTQAPTFFKLMYGWTTTKTGILSGIPHLGRAFLAIVYGIFSDFLLSNNIISRTNVRKLAAIICTVGMGVLLLFVLFVPGCNEMAITCILFSAVAVHGAVSSGPLANVVDLSPNFAGVIQGMVGTAVSLTGFLSAHIVGVLTNNNQTLEQWRKVYGITSCMLVSSGVLYLFLAQARVQKWNKPSKEPQPTEEEMDFIKS